MPDLRKAHAVVAALLLLLPTGVIVWLGCSTPSRPLYDVSALTVAPAEVLPDGAVRVRVRPPAETLWHCPGADLDRRSDKFLLRLVRARIEDSPGVDVAARGPDADGFLVIDVPDPGGRSVLIDDGTSTREVHPAANRRPGG